MLEPALSIIVPVHDDASNLAVCLAASQRLTTALRTVAGTERTVAFCKPAGTCSRNQSTRLFGCQAPTQPEP
jgi:hypothetical protein